MMLPTRFQNATTNPEAAVDQVTFGLDIIGDQYVALLDHRAQIYAV